jgi:hypothetical protein
MIFIGVVETITSAKKQTANGKHNGHDRQNYFKIEHVLRYLDKVTQIFIS